MMLSGSVTTWWNGLMEFQQAMFIVAVITTLFLAIQIVLMIIGLADDDSSFDADTSIDDVDIFNNEDIADMAGLKLVSVRTVIAFICMGSWATFLTVFWIEWYFALIIGLLVGAAAAYGVAYAMKAAMRLQGSGNIQLENAIGKIGDVYLTIPANRSGAGKVSILVQERLIEREALTDSETPIKTGEKVRVIDVLNQGTVIVASVLGQKNF